MGWIDRQMEGDLGKLGEMSQILLSILEFWQVVILGYVLGVYDCCEMRVFPMDSDYLSVRPFIHPSIL